MASQEPHVIQEVRAELFRGVERSGTNIIGCVTAVNIDTSAIYL
jgi:hypothetical protein